MIKLLAHLILAAQLALNPAYAAEEGATEAAEAKDSHHNNRVKTLAGSRSLWSGQFNLTYNGSTLDHPFSNKMPNPGHEVPPPLTTLTGTMALRHRPLPHTSFGLGVGIRTQQPFQGPKHTTVNNPYLDIGHGYRTGPIHHRAIGQVQYYTDYNNHEVFGYRFAFTGINDGFFEFDFGLTAGIFVQVDYFTFAGNRDYPQSQQVVYDFVTAPYLDYRISQVVTARTSVGIMALHTRNLNGMFKYHHPKPYQNLGLGIAVADGLFFYPYVKFYPYSGNMSWSTSFFGFNTIVNVF